MEKKDEWKPINERRGDPRVSGPLDRRLASVDHQDFSIPPEGQHSGIVRTTDKMRFAELVEQFAAQINLPDLRVSADNCCSISIGEGQEAVVVSVELRSEGEIVIFTPLERYPQGITQELASRIEIISAAQQDNCHYLATSKHSVFFCAGHTIAEATTMLFADWVLDFYKRALTWRERYRRDTASVSTSVRTSSSTGLKA